MQVREANRYQKRFYLEWSFNPQSLVYHTPLIYRLVGDINLTALEQALRHFVNIHDVGCRSTFQEIAGQIRQYIAKEVPVFLQQLEVVDEIEVQACLQEQLSHCFDLQKGPLFRFVLIRPKTGQPILFYLFHHIITDAQSAALFVDALQKLYLHYHESTVLVLTPNPVLFSEDEKFVSEQEVTDLHYWQNLLRDKNLYIDLPKKISLNQLDEKAFSHYFTLDEILSNEVKVFCRSVACTPFLLFAAVFAIVLAQYSGQEEIALNYPIDLRKDRNAIGCFVNNVILINEVLPDKTLLDLITALKQQRKQGKLHQKLSLSEIVQVLRKQGHLSDNKFLNVSLIEAYFDQSPINLGAAQLVPLPVPERAIGNEINLAYQHAHDGFEFRLDYRQALFSSYLIENVCKAFQFILAKLIQFPNQSLATIQLLPPEMETKLIQFAGEVSSYELTHDIVTLFHTQVKRYPTKTALVVPNEPDVTYQELGGEVNQVSQVLSWFGEDLVGVYLKNKRDVPAAFLGVLASGAAYIPLDSQWPEARILERVRDSGITLILTDQASSGIFSKINKPIKIVYIDSLPVVTGQPSHVKRVPNSLAYIMYTSGSTGRPKGVMIEFASLNQVITDFIERLEVTAEDRVVGATAIGFDIFALELYVALCSGASLLLLDEEVKDPHLLYHALDAFKPTIVQGTPSFWSLLALLNWQPVVSSKPLRVLCGGESLSKTLASFLCRCASAVYQVYGPTETTIWSSCKKLVDPEEYAVIGRPIQNTRFYVLSLAQELVPVGVPGELYIGGIGLSRGYAGQPEQTQERFISWKGERLYRTGDQVYWNESGELVYLGRLDFQVKIRGHRIELGEIEYYLNRYPAISQAVVQPAFNQTQAGLQAFLLRHEAEHEAERLKAYLRERLPIYMVPNQFIFVETFPLSSNGKIDRKALQVSVPALTNQAPSFENQIESQLGELWQQVLEMKNIHRQQHFFELGGHSLLAAKMLLKAEQMFRVRLSLADLMRYPTIAELAGFICNHKPENVLRLPTGNASSCFTLSLQQQDLLGVERFFNLAVVNQLRGILNMEALHAALEVLFTRHTILRCVFEKKSGVWQQRVIPIQEPLLTIGSLDEIKDLEVLIHQPFEVSQGPLYRVHLLRTDKNHYYFIFVISHLLVDGWSFEILNQELSQLYADFCKGTEPALPVLTYHYADFVIWQQQWLSTPAFQSVEAFWKSKMAGYEGLKWSSDFPVPKQKSYRGAHYHWKIDAASLVHYKKYAARVHTTIFNILLAAYAILIRRYSSQSDLVIAVPFANRMQGSEKIVGLLTSLLPIRINVNENASFQILQEEVQRLMLEAEAYCGGSIAKWGQYIQAVFTLQNANQRFAVALEEIEAEAIQIEDHIARYDLHFTAQEISGELHCTFEYCTDLFLPNRIVQMVQDFNVILASSLDREASICTVPTGYLPTYSFITCAHTRKHNNLCDWFKDVVCQYPHWIALTEREQHWTYLQLDEASTQLAYYLRVRYRTVYGEEFGRDVLIGVCLERGYEMIVAILAVLKAGAAYVPLDPHYPPQRLIFMLEDSQSALVISKQEILQRSELLPFVANEKLIRVDALPKEVPLENLPKINPNQLAYVIYTSGSTGTPKGALLEHHNVVRLFLSSEGLFEFNEQDIWCLFHSFAFDFSVWEMWGALLYGGRLVIVPYHVSRDPVQFRHLLATEKITVLNQTPTAFSRLIQLEASQSDRLPLRYVIFGGEALDTAALKSWWDIYPDSPQLVNMYGITETTVHVTFKRLTLQDLEKSYLNDIGKPLPDLRAYVLDTYYNLAPMGVVGELYIAGEGLARGYWQRDDLTTKAFLNGEQIGLPEIRLYKTGDLARWLDNGHLEYLGRSDHQVKVRGFRIELGEIQAVLMKRIPGIQAAFVYHESTYDEIRAYFIAEEKKETAATWADLKKYLPEFMVPHRLIQVDTFPVTVNGKIDRAQLLKMTEPSQLDNVPSHYVLPRSQVERQLEAIWSEVLDRPPLGIDAHFFTSGGDSIRSLEVVQRASEQGLFFTPQDLYEAPTVADLALRIKQKPIILQQTSSHSEENEAVYPLAALQEGMLFHSEWSKQTSAYIDVISCHVKAVFEPDIFNLILTKIVDNHSILRTVLVNQQGRYSQKALSKIVLPLVIAEGQIFDPAPLTEIRFNMDQDVLWRLWVYPEPNTGFYLVLVCHHAILDGWSVATFFTQLLKNYALALAGQPLSLIKPHLSYQDFVRQEQIARQSTILKQFWQDYLDRISPCLLAESSLNMKCILRKQHFKVDVELSTLLQQLSKKWSIPLDTMLFAAHLWMISCFSGCQEVLTGLASHNRIAQESGESVLGLFLNTLPFRFAWKKQGGVRDLLNEIQNEKQKIYAYRSYPLLDIQRDLKQGVLFDSLFNFIHFHVVEALQDVPGLTVTPAYCYEETNFALVTQAECVPLTKQLEITLVYHSNQLEENQIILMQHLYMQALHLIAYAEEKTIWQILFTEELHAFYPPYHWNEGSRPDLAETRIEQAFAKQVQKVPQQIAVQGPEGSLTYAQLEAAAEQLAKQLDEVPPRALVGVLARRETFTIIAMLALLKRGAAYVPIDPNLPEEKITELKQDESLIGILAADSDLKTLHVPIAYRTETDLAYVMYTSGSTGRPKGVMVDHLGVLRLVQKPDYISLTSDDRIAQAASLCFDAATFEIWGALLSGATLVLVPPDILLDATAFGVFLQRERITVLWLTARLFDQYIHAGQAAIFKDLRYLLVGGDSLNKQTMRILLQCPQGRPQWILNGYGPTENTTFTCVHRIDEMSLEYDSIPIGQPIAHTDAYILDELHRPVPVGTVGELYTGGLGLAYGYLNAPQLTAERFIEIEIYDERIKNWVKKRLYRTYDAAKWLASGEIAFLGRKDRTSKINGYRVNLAEVESVITAIAGIKSCLLIEQKIQDRTVLALYYLTEQSRLSSAELRAQILQKLPVHMVPHHFICLTEFPLTANGKVDVKALPSVRFDNVISVNTNASLSPTMKKLHEIWIQLLGVQNLDIHDHFFERGGDSLLAMQLHYQIKTIFETELSIVDVFRYASIAEMAGFLDQTLGQDSQAKNFQRTRTEQVLTQRLRMKNLLKK